MGENSDNRSADIPLVKKRNRLLKWTKRLVVLGLVGAAGWYFWGPKEVQVEYVSEAVRTGSVREIVEVTGSVESERIMNLKFQSSGQVAKVLVRSGQPVEKGTLLMELDSDNQQILLEQAEAMLAAAQADLDLRYAGPTKQELAITETEIDASRTLLLHSVDKIAETRKTNEENLKKGELEVANAEKALENALVALENAEKTGGISEEKAGKTYSNSLEDVKKTMVSAIDAVRHSNSVADSILETKTEAGKAHQLYLGFKEQNKKVQANNDYRLARSREQVLAADWERASGDWTEASALTLVDTLETEIDRQKAFLDNLFDVLGASRIGSTLTQTEVDAFKTAVKTEQAALLTALDSVRNARQSISDAEIDISSAEVATSSSADSARANVIAATNALEVARRNLEQIKLNTELAESSIRREIDTRKIDLEKNRNSMAKLVASPRDVDVAALQALVHQRMAAWKQARIDFENTRVIAPVGGIVTDIKTEVGENVTQNDVVVELMADGLQVRANIPETDIAQLSVGNPVEMTFDAFSSDEMFTGSVIEIDPAETVIQGVIYYQILIGFDAADPKIKSGMTADISILSGEKDDVLIITPEALRYEDNLPFVYVLEGGKCEAGKIGEQVSTALSDDGQDIAKEEMRREIKTGLDGDRAIEVISGLASGECVILYEKEPE